MNSILRVHLSGVPVGRLAMNAQGEIVFQYEESWIQSGFDLSPGTLPFNGEANQSVRPGEFEGLHGVFNDSLPDGWGLLLMDRALKQHKNLDPHEINPLYRLAYLGHRCMGALEYEPEILPELGELSIDLERIASESEGMLQGVSTEVIEELRIYGGSPGGARPKVTVAFNDDMTMCCSGFKDIPVGFSHWIVKFRNASRQGNADPSDIGLMEKAYAEMASEAGLIMPKTDLLNMRVNRNKESYFAVKRFDRAWNRKIHFLSLSGYAHANHRVPCLDYGSGVFAATKKLTRSTEEVAKAFRLMVFNIFAHNKDDHAKNFAYLYDSEAKQWTLSPAFDLTFNYGMSNFHTTSINGSGNPSYSDIKKLGEQFGIKQWAIICDEVRGAVSKWASFASQYGLTKTRIGEISKALRVVDRECSSTK
jgi:serine/threonine-protein kinase HipA